MACHTLGAISKSKDFQNTLSLSEDFSEEPLSQNSLLGTSVCSYVQPPNFTTSCNFFRKSCIFCIKVSAIGGGSGKLLFEKTAEKVWKLENSSQFSEDSEVEQPWKWNFLSEFWLSQSGRGVQNFCKNCRKLVKKFYASSCSDFANKKMRSSKNGISAKKMRIPKKMQSLVEIHR